MPKQPDIILMVLDTQRADRLSCYGYPFGTSPHLDSFAEEAALFSRAVAPGQWTIPTHASIFTGLYPSQHTVDQMDSVLPTAVTTLAERLTNAGYFTAGFSHNPLIGMVANGLDRGFQSFSNFNYLGAGLLSVNLSSPSRSGGVTTRLRATARFLVAETLGYSQKTPLDVFAPFSLPVWKKFLHWRRASKVAKVEDSLRMASELFLNREGTSSGQPIFAFINLMGTHVPYDPPRWALQKFLADNTSYAKAQKLLQQSNSLQADVRNWLDMPLPESDFKTVLDAVYDAEVAEQDAQIGRFLEQLRLSKNWQDTMMVVVADHGDHLGDKNRVNHAFGVSEALVHVPLLIRDPTGCLPKGQTVDSTVSTRRLFHTILQVAKTAVSDESNLSLLAGEESHAVLAEGQPLNWAIERLERSRPGVVKNLGFDDAARAIYSDNYKFIVRGSHQELYDLQADAGEKKNLVAKMPDLAKQLYAHLQQQTRNLQPIADAESHMTAEDDVVRQHLRSLGYME